MFKSIKGYYTLKCW